MTGFKSDVRHALRPRPLPWYRQIWISFRIYIALLRLRAFGVPKVSDEEFERAALKYRSDKSLP